MARQLVTLPQALEQRPWATERYLRRLITERRIPFHKIGPGRAGRILLDLADLDLLAEQSRIEPRRRLKPPRGTTRAADPGRSDVSSAGGLEGGRRG